MALPFSPLRILTNFLSEHLISCFFNTLKTWGSILSNSVSVFTFFILISMCKETKNRLCKETKKFKLRLKAGNQYPHKKGLV